MLGPNMYGIVFFFLSMLYVTLGIIVEVCLAGLDVLLWTGMCRMTVNNEGWIFFRFNVEIIAGKNTYPLKHMPEAMKRTKLGPRTTMAVNT